MVANVAGLLPKHPASPINENTVNPQSIRPSWRFMLSHPAHCIALGFGSGLSRIAPGTAGTLWAWVTFAWLAPWMSDWLWGVTLLLSLPLGWWACTVTARHMNVPDPGSIVWDEIIAFWLVLWLVMPTGFWGQLVAFALFRFFDAVKPGPVGWADRLFHDLDMQTDPAACGKINVPRQQNEQHAHRQRGGDGELRHQEREIP